MKHPIQKCLKSKSENKLRNENCLKVEILFLWGGGREKMWEKRVADPVLSHTIFAQTTDWKSDFVPFPPYKTI